MFTQILHVAQVGCLRDAAAAWDKGFVECLVFRSAQVGFLRCTLCSDRDDVCRDLIFEFRVPLSGVCERLCWEIVGEVWEVGRLQIDMPAN